MRLTRTIIATPVILFPLACIIIVAALIAPYSDFWGIPPNYNPNDYDKKLEEEAKSALPIITKIDQYYNKNKAYPKSLKDVGIERSGWIYNKDKSTTSYSISTRVGRDPYIYYEKSPTNARWAFAAGDGCTPDKEIKLSTPPPSHNQSLE